MGYVDELKALTVRIGGVNGGSGVLMKPLDRTVLYILTASHCLEDDEVTNLNLSFEDSIYEDVSIEVQKIYRDENTDAAIIVVKRFDDNVKFVGFANKPNDSHVRCYNTGFPLCRQDGNSRRQLAIRDVNRILHDRGNLVEFSFTQIPQKRELKGLSGGGIFNDKYQLLGIHKQSACKDNDELLGSALYIPCKFYQSLIETHGLSPIYEFDLSTFKPFKDNIFNFDNKGLMTDLEALLGAMSVCQTELNKKSPKDLFEAFQEQRKCCLIF